MDNFKKSRIRIISFLCTFFLAFSLVAPFTVTTVHAAGDAVNVALNKPVTSSDGENITAAYPPAEAVDGIGLNFDNGWDSQSSLTMAGAWLQIDLQNQYVISRVEIDDRPDPGWDGTRKCIEIRASNDPTFEEYVVLGGTGDTAFPANSTWTLDVSDINAYRYVRYVKTIQLYAFLSEIRVFGTPAETEEPEDPGEPSNMAEFYVDPHNGSDENDGSIGHPFATIEKARDVVRTVNSDMDGNIVVYLRGGEYGIDSTIEFEERDSGTNGFRIIYRSYEGETPVLSGARRITGWMEENGIFRTNVGGLKFRDLYINGQRGMRARTESYSISLWNTSGRTFSITSTAFDSWESFDAEKIGKIEAVLNTHWIESYTRMDSFLVNGSSAAVRLAPAGEIIFTRANPDRAVNQSVHFENTLEFMDKPGEWFLDEDNGDLYYIPREGETLAGLDTLTGAIETFISIKGNAGSTVSNITISGITFEYTTFENPVINNGVIFAQGGFVRNTGSADIEGGRQPAAVYMEGADNIRIERNVFRHLGATAIDVYYKAHNNEIIGNTLTDIAGNGIVAGVFANLPLDYSHSNPLTYAQGTKIKNNYLSGISADYYCGTGILAGYTNGTEIEHNEVSNVGYSGIAVGYGWTGNTTSLGNIRINYNNIYNYMTRSSDGAGIYTLSKTPNSELAGNYIHDDDRNQFASNYPIVAIYLDQKTSGYNVHDNVSDRVDVKLNLNMVDEGANIITNNDSQDGDIKRNAGLEPQYWDIVPGAFRKTAGDAWAAPTYGGVRINGTVSVSEAVYDAVYSASIYKNDMVVWGPAPVEAVPDTSYDLYMDVLPNDVISFIAEDSEGSVTDAVYWDSFIKPEIYIPRLVIESVSHPDQTEPAEISDKTKTVTLKVKPGTDITDFHPVITTPPGTELVYENGISSDYSSPVKMRVYMEDGSEFPGFDGGRKYKVWEVKVLVESEAAFFKGFNIGEQIADTDNWFISAGNIEAGTNSISFSQGGYSVYKAKTFSDELVEFYMNTPAQGWPAVTFRNQSNTAEGIGENSSCYITVIKPDLIELQRFNNGQRVPLYITGVGEDVPLIGPAIPNTFFNHGEDNLVQLGAMNTDEGVRLLMYINGKKVFDCIDRWEGKIIEPGYFGTHQYGGPITLMKAPAVTSLNSAIADSDSWYISAGTKTAGTNSISLGQGGYAVYQGQQFQDELFELTMNTEAAGWPSIIFRNQSATADGIGPDSSCYITVIKPDLIELQRFNNGQRVPLYITGVGENAPLIGPAIPNTFFNHGENNLVHIGAINTDEGVRLIMYVNGLKVFDCIDQWEGRITGPGYFGTYQASAPIVLSKTPESTSLASAIADTDSWYMSAGEAEAGAGSITLGQGGYAIYQAQQYDDEMLEFYMNTAATGWPSITFRNQSASADPIGTGGDCYITVIKPDVIELQRFNNGQRVPLYITGIGEDEPLIGPAIPNTFFIHGQDNLVQLGAVNTDEGVRLIMYINGKKVFDCMDRWDGKITEPGYFGTYQAASAIKLGKIFEISGEIDKFALLDFEIAKVTGKLAAAPIGTAEGQYALWAKEYLEAALTAAQQFRDGAGEETPQEEVNEALRLLKAAEAVFEKSLNQMTNIALGKTVTSSDEDNIYDGHEPLKLVDGTVSSTNGWSPTSYEAMNAWAQIDLGSVSTIKRIVVVDRPGTDASGTWYGERRNFEIQASNTPDFTEGTYVVLGSVGEEPFPDNTAAGWELNVPEGTQYRYIRYQKTEKLYFYISEIRVLGAVAPETFTVGGTVKNQANQPVAGASVKLYSYADMANVLGAAETAVDGSYTINGEHLAGKYVVKAEKASYNAGSKTIYIPYADVADADITLNPKGNGGNNIPTPKPTPTSKPTPAPAAPGKVDTGELVTDKEKGTTTANVDTAALAHALTGSAIALIDIPKVEGTRAYIVSLPTNALSSGNANHSIKVATEFGTITAPSDMIRRSDIAGAKEIGLSVGKVDIAALDADMQAKIGNRPVIELNLLVDGAVKAWNNPDAPVTVSIPYAPTAAELADPEHITVWYIDGSGNAVSVPAGRYDAATGMVTFSTTHFSKYAVAFVKKTFNDLAAYPWARKEIEVMASKGILNGTSADTYSPAETITRADFMVLLVNALGLTAAVDSSFSDISPDAYYARQVGIAKKLGITTGVGNNRFNPGERITRQDIMVMVDRAMDAAGKSLTKGTDADIDEFADKASLAAYAVQSAEALVRNGIIAGDGTNLKPRMNVTRAESAVVIYRIYNK